MTRTRILAGAVTVAFAALAAVIVIAVQQGRGHSETVTTGQVAQRTMEHQSALAAKLGANTTMHEVVITYDTAAQAALNKAPANQRSEGWWAFGPDGKLAAYYGETHDLDTGALTGTQKLAANGTLVVNSPSGTHRFANYSQMTASAVAARIDGEVSAFKAALTAPDAATTATASNGEYALTLPHERDYVAQTTYRLLKVEALDASGAVTQTREYPTLEVLDGAAVPTPPVATATP